MNDIKQLMRAANPAPDSNATLSDDDFAALLLLTQSRSRNMDVKDIVTPAEPETPKRSGWLVAAAAFAAIVVVVGVAVLLMRPTTDVAPAATPPTTEAAVDDAASTTTTAVPDIVTETERAAADQVVDALNARDMAALWATMTDTASVVLRIERTPTPGAPGVARSRELVERYIGVDFALGTTWAITNCLPASTPTSVRCDVEATEPLREAFGLGVLSALLLIDVGDDGLIVSFDLRWDDRVVGVSTGTWWQDLSDFTEWVEATYPDDFVIMTFAGDQIRTSPESLELWTQHVSEFLELTDG